jgi:hypothetical protein
MLTLPTIHVLKNATGLYRCSVVPNSSFPAVIVFDSDFVFTNEGDESAQKKVIAYTNYHLTSFHVRKLFIKWMAIVAVLAYLVMIPIDLMTVSPGGDKVPASVIALLPFTLGYAYSYSWIIRKVTRYLHYRDPERDAVLNVKYVQELNASSAARKWKEKHGYVNAKATRNILAKGHDQISAVVKEINVIPGKMELIEEYAKRYLKTGIIYIPEESLKRTIASVPKCWKDERIAKNFQVNLVLAAAKLVKEHAIRNVLKSSKRSIAIFAVMAAFIAVTFSISPPYLGNVELMILMGLEAFAVFWPMLVLMMIMYKSFQFKLNLLQANRVAQHFKESQAIMAVPG